VDPTLDAQTLQPSGTRRRAGPTTVTRLVILAHPTPARVGACCALTDAVEISRTTPHFDDDQPLRDRFISRAPLRLNAAGAVGWTLSARETRTAVVVDGVAVAGTITLSSERLEAGVVIELGGRVALLLERTNMGPDAAAAELLGVSAGLAGVRHAVAQVADLDVPVLVRGPTGAGKELVARAVHAQSTRAAGPFAAVNMGAIAPNLAASELFGHARGAFSGATGPRAGLFAEADGGTLFLDEIGEASPEIQAALLRALETGEIRPVGGTPRVVDVRLVAATDADLEAAIAEGRFRGPLLHRLGGFCIDVPPLGARRADIGVLAYHFAARSLATIGRPDALEAEPPFLPAAVVGALARCPWPGNVRGLRNAVQQLVIRHRSAPQIEADAVARVLKAEPTPVPAEAPKTPYRRARDVGDGELLDALRTHGFAIKATAAALGVSRTALYGLIDRSATLRKAGEVPDAEIHNTWTACGGQLDQMATRLEVSPAGLRARLGELGLKPGRGPAAGRSR
jgi:two-component system nitrogen regulation response regulator GlnG